MCTPKRVTSLPAAKFSRTGIWQLFPALALAAALSFCLVMPAGAQIPVNAPPPPPPGTQPQQPSSGKGGIKVDVNLVLLHTTVLDDRGRFAEGLKLEAFPIFQAQL